MIMLLFRDIKAIPKDKNAFKLMLTIPHVSTYIKGRIIWIDVVYYIANLQIQISVYLLS